MLDGYGAIVLPTPLSALVLMYTTLTHNYLRVQLPQPLQLLQLQLELLDKAEDPPPPSSPPPILLTRIILFLRSTRNYYSRHTLYK